MAEQAAVNRQVSGSSPDTGAIFRFKGIQNDFEILKMPLQKNTAWNGRK